MFVHCWLKNCMYFRMYRGVSVILHWKMHICKSYLKIIYKSISITVYQIVAKIEWLTYFGAQRIESTCNLSIRLWAAEQLKFLISKGLEHNLNSKFSNFTFPFLMSRKVSMGIFFIILQILKVQYRVTSKIHACHVKFFSL